MSFANQALASEYLLTNRAELGRQVHRVPEEVDREIAGLTLAAMGVGIDTLTPEQEEYLASWHMGRRRGMGLRPGPGVIRACCPSPGVGRLQSLLRGGSLLIELKVQSLGLDRASNTPVVILQELEGDRVLPIWIGPGEASAIAMQLADMAFSRPLTHDLLLSAVKGLGANLDRVVITRVSDSTYYAELVLDREGETVKVDARPSDSIAVALRADARIFANDALLERASIEITEEEDVAHEEGGMPESPGEEQSFSDAEELKEYLRRLNPEDFGRFIP